MLTRNKELEEVIKFQRETLQDQAMRIEVKGPPLLYELVNFYWVLRNIIHISALVSPELHAEGDDRQSAEDVRAAGEGRDQSGGGERQAEGGGCQWQGQDTDVRDQSTNLY